MAKSQRIIYYYQTFKGLDDLINDPNSCHVTHIHLASIHFGLNKNFLPYIHLNDYSPSNSIFDNVWKQLSILYSRGIKIVLMVGGAGGAFMELFSNFKAYYNLLLDTIKQYDIITGIDLDIEEIVSLKNIKMLMRQIKTDFPSKDFIITMAPLGSSLQYDSPGMGGFVYKDLYTSPEGEYIEYFNGQFYMDYSSMAYNSCISNGYPENKVVMGMITGEDFTNVKETIKELCKQYKNFGGAYNWEYFNSPPAGITYPGEWAKTIYEILSESNSEINIKNKSESNSEDKSEVNSCNVI